MNEKTFALLNKLWDQLDDDAIAFAIAYTKLTAEQKKSVDARLTQLTRRVPIDEVLRD